VHLLSKSNACDCGDVPKIKASFIKGISRGGLLSSSPDMVRIALISHMDLLRFVNVTSIGSVLPRGILLLNCRSRSWKPRIFLFFRGASVKGNMIRVQL